MILRGTADKVYEFDIQLHGDVVKEESKFRTEARNVFLNIKKKEKGPYWPRLLKEATKHQWLHVDWNMYVDEDEDDGEVDLGQNFNDFGAGGAEDEDSDDKEDISKDIPKQETASATSNIL
jgi:prostaglandin-E synthase